MRAFFALMLAVLSSPAHAENKRIAVIEFIGTAPNAVLLDITDEARLGVLDATKGHAYSIMTRESMNSIASDNDIDLSNCTASECEVDTGRAIGAHFVITGKLSGSDGRYKAMIKVFNTESAAVLAGDTFRAQTLAALEDNVRSFTAGITADALKLGGSRTMVPDVALDPSLTGEVQVTTGSGTDYAALAARAAQAKAIREQREAQLAEQARIEAAAREAERQRLAEQERRAKEALAQEQARRFEKARDEILAKSRADLEHLRPLLSMEVSPETRPVLMQYLEEYEEAAVTLDGKRRAVDVPGVREVLATLDRPSAVERKRLETERQRERERLAAEMKAAKRRAALRRKNKRRETAWVSSMAWATYIAPLAVTGTVLPAMNAETNLAEDVAQGKISKTEWERRRGHINRTYVASYILLGSIIPAGVTAAILAPDKPAAKSSNGAGGDRPGGLRVEVSGAW